MNPKHGLEVWDEGGRPVIQHVPRHYEQHLLEYLQARRVTRPEVAQTAFGITGSSDAGGGHKFIFDPAYKSEDLQKILDEWEPPPDF